MNTPALYTVHWLKVQSHFNKQITELPYVVTLVEQWHERVLKQIIRKLVRSKSTAQLRYNHHTQVAMLYMHNTIKI